MSSQRPPCILYGFIMNRDVILVSHHEESQAGVQVDYSDIITKVQDYTTEIPLCEDSLKFTISDADSTCITHVIVEEGNVYGCITPQGIPTYSSFLFLSKLRDKMAEQPSLISRSYRATEQEFDRDLGPVLAQLMDDFNNGRVDDKLMNAQSQVLDVKEVLVQNIEKIMRRGELLDDLLNKTESLESQGRSFRQASRTLAIRVWWKNMKLWIVIGVVVSVCVTLAILYFAQVFKKK